MTSESVTLALDTSHQVSVAVARGRQVLARHTVADTRAHVEQLTPLITRCLGEAGISGSGLDQIVIGLGPGPFTGLRVGVVTGWTLSETIGVPWHGVCSLDVVAHQWAQTESELPDDFVVCCDARRSELYWARYHRLERVAGPHVSAPDGLPDLATIGSGLDHYADQLGDRIAGGPRALDPGVMAVVGPQLPSAGAEPLYLRRPDAAVPGKRKSALPTGPRLLKGLTPRKAGS